MVKSYLHAFISMKYVWILPAFAFVIFIFSALFMTFKIAVLRYIVFGLAIILAILMVRFYGERMTISSKLRKLNNWREYNDSYIIGQAFLLDERMLVYDNKIVEMQYSEITKIYGEPGKKDRYTLTFETSNQKVKDITSSEGQAERFAYFLQTKNQNIQFEGITPSGDGKIEHIESGK